MSISNTTESAILKLVYNATAWANYAINATSSPQTNIDVGLHTGDPGEAGTMATSETGYGNYVRVSVSRDTGGWTETTGSVSPVANIDFALGNGSPDTVSFFSTGKTGGGSSAILWSGTVTPNIATGNGITPRLTTATTITLDLPWYAIAAAVYFLFHEVGTVSWLGNLAGIL